MRICFHTHCFPDALAPRAMAILTENCKSEAITPHTDGTARGAMERLRRAGIDRAVICNIATNTHQETKVNDFAISLIERDGFFFPLGSVHPDSEQIEHELDRLLSAGIKGIKLHPDYVRIPLPDPRFDRIFSHLEERGMLAVIHAGLDPVSPMQIHATPQMIRRTIDRHPSLTLVAAHMGGFRLAAEVEKYLVGTPVYLDTSLSAGRPAEHEALIRILNKHDENRLLFATDTPWSDPAAEVAFIENAGLSEIRKAKIFSENALCLLSR